MAADKILEGPWWDVVIKDLNLMSYYFAKDFALQTKGSVDKNYLDGTLAYKLQFEEWPPMRLMSLNLILSYWLGRHVHGMKYGLSWIEEAYTASFNEYLKSPEGKNQQATPKPAETVEPTPTPNRDEIRNTQDPNTTT